MMYNVFEKNHILYLHLRCFARSRTSLYNNNAFSHLGAYLTTVTFRKIEFSNPSRTRNCMVTRECDKTRWCRSCILFTIPSAVKTPSQLFLRDGSSSPSFLSLSFSVSLVFSRIPANAGSTSHFWILIPPGRRITRPSAYDFIRGG